MRYGSRAYHYKWRGDENQRCRRTFLQRESFRRGKNSITSGNSSIYCGKPLYHWTHLELARYFDIHDLLSPSTAEKIFDKASAMIRTPAFSTRSLITKMNVEVICTTDDPADNL
ncbi:MAG: glucuronate isomerase [Bacteroidales bacterium]